jgi:hypothetical protein
MSLPTRVVRRPAWPIFLAALVAVVALGVHLGRRAAPTVAGPVSAPSPAGERVSAAPPPSLPAAIAPRSTLAPRAAGEWQGMRIDTAETALCDAIDACGLAMACIGGRCGACTGDDSCAAGERCVLDHCVRTEHAACRTRADCGGDELCILGGYSADPRGNAGMTARCVGAQGGIPEAEGPVPAAGAPAGVVPVPAAELLEQAEADLRGP